MINDEMEVEGHKQINIKDLQYLTLNLENFKVIMERAQRSVRNGEG